MHVNDPKSRTPVAAPCLSQVTERARETKGNALRPLAYGISDAAKVSGLSRSTLDELIKSGELHSVRSLPHGIGPEAACDWVGRY